MSVEASWSFRLTGTAEELDGFIRSVDDLDELEIASISYGDDQRPGPGETNRRVGEEISVDVSFGHTLSAQAIYELVMDQFRNFQREGLDLRIEQIDDGAPGD